MNGECRMKKVVIVSLLLALVLFAPAISFSQTKGANDGSVYDPNQPLAAEDSLQVNLKVPLSNTAIESLWPNLPTAEELWDSKVKCWIDMRDYGKLDASTDVSALEASSYVSDARIAAEPIMNYTSDVPAMLTGGVLRDVPSIWLQYNETIWVQVPIDLLMATRAATAQPQPETTTPNNTWALGIYSNPALIAGSNPVYGAMTFGAWGNYNPSSSAEYHYSDILSVYDGTYKWQLCMGEDINGKFVEIQGWLGTSMVYWSTTRPSVTEGTLYNEYIKYNPQYRQWESYWNFQLIGPRISDGQWCIQTGNQPNVCVESND